MSAVGSSRQSAVERRNARLARLEALLAERILVLDGAMGTMIQAHRLGEADYRGARFAPGGVVAQARY